MCAAEGEASGGARQALERAALYSRAESSQKATQKAAQGAGSARSSGREQRREQALMQLRLGLRLRRTADDTREPTLHDAALDVIDGVRQAGDGHAHVRHQHVVHCLPVPGPAVAHAHSRLVTGVVAPLPNSLAV